MLTLTLILTLTLTLSPTLTLTLTLTLALTLTLTLTLGQVLEAKLVAEKYLRASGLDWTIVRPGGLKADPPTGALFVSGENTPSCLSRARPVKGRCGRPASVRPKRLIGRGGPELRAA